MGARGPAPTPTVILSARGSWRAKKRQGEPTLPVKRPTCPRWLKGEARAEWHRQVQALAGMRVMAKCDRASLAAYCQAWAEFADVSQKLEQTGLIVKTAAGNYIQNPLIPIRNRAVARFVSLAQQFGFTPSARTRLRAMEEGHGQEESNSDKSRFFRGAG